MYEPIYLSIYTNMRVRVCLCLCAFVCVVACVRACVFTVLKSLRFLPIFLKSYETRYARLFSRSLGARVRRKLIPPIAVPIPKRSLPPRRGFPVKIMETQAIRGRRFGRSNSCCRECRGSVIPRRRRRSPGERSLKKREGNLFYEYEIRS